MVGAAKHDLLVVFSSGIVESNTEISAYCCQCNRPFIREHAVSNLYKSLIQGSTEAKPDRAAFFYFRA